MRTLFFLLPLSIAQLLHPVVAASDETVDTDKGYIIQLVEHDNDIKKSKKRPEKIKKGRIKWWLTLPDGKPLDKIGSQKGHHPRFFFPMDQVESFYGAQIETPGYNRITFVIHAKKPHKAFNNGFAHLLGIGQRHHHFLVNINLKCQPEYTTVPDKGVNMLTDVNYNFPEDECKSYIELRLNPFLDAKILTTINQPQNLDMYDGIKK